MKRHGLILFLVALLILPVFAVTVTSCGGKEVKKETGLTDEEKARLEAERLAREKAEREAEARRKAEEMERQRLAAARAAFLNDYALFDFDKYNVRPDAEIVLRAKADYMKEMKNLVVEVQGHCDERGTNQYNMALGDRRAKSAKNFMESLGVNGMRMSTVSYGEERPVCSDNTEACWQQNRRAQFVIVSE